MEASSSLFRKPGIYLHMISGAASLGNQKKSLFTQMLIKAQPYILEDGKSFCSMEEALEWATVNRFSPLNTGFRMTPL